MIVVHGVVAVDGRPACWAESTATGPFPRRHGRRPVPHPFAVAPPVDGESGTAVLALPSVGSQPLGSPELGLRAGRGAVRTLPWTVPVGYLDPAMDLEERVGSSVGYLRDVGGFAADLVRRGRVLPGIVEVGGRFEARWRGVLTGRDAERYQSLWRAMPGVAGAAMPERDAGSVTRLALDHQIDSLVRTKARDRLAGPFSAGVVGSWLSALVGQDAGLDGDTGALDALRHHLDGWADSGTPASVRTCFRLRYVEEFPDGEEPGWVLEFLLQPVDEPSLLVPVEQVWRDAPSPLMRWVDYPQEVLLTGLGRASRLYPDLDDALRTAFPSRMRLDVAGAHRFLTYAPVLEEAGFGVLVPSVWQRRQNLGLALTVHSRQPTVPVLRDTTANRDAIVDYRWGLALGDLVLNEADLVELGRAKVPLVRLRGRWVLLDDRRLRAGLDFLARGGSGEMTAGEAMRLTRLIPDETVPPLPVTVVEGSGWLADLLTGRAVERLELVDPPASLSTALRPYQMKGFSWLVFMDRLGIGALLADDMGLGKTVQTLALEAHLRERGPRAPTLVVCPLSVLGNWRREIERFTPSLRVYAHHDRSRGVVPPADLVLTTYQVAARDVELLAGMEWDRIVLDEAQHVKNATGATARAIRRIPARHRVALTGTPVENRLTELWSIAEFLNPGLLGAASLFQARYGVPIERYGDAESASRLRRATRVFLLRRVKTDRAVIADLPAKRERRQWCNLTIEQATLYRAVVDEMLLRLREGHAGPRRKGLVLAAITKLKQVCNHPAHLLRDGSSLAGRSGKLDRLEEILTNALADGDKALVFTQYAAFGGMLAPYLADRLGTSVDFLHGGTAKGARDAMVERFQSSAGHRVLLLSLKAGGLGLNLTAANHVVHVDRWWNPASEQQATDRAYRIGQGRDVEVHTFVCVGTVEERIDTIMAQKRTLAGVAVGNGEGWLTGLSTADLADLVSLSPEASGE